MEMGILIMLMCLMVVLSGYCGWIVGGIIGYFTVGVAASFFVILIIEGGYSAGKKAALKKMKEENKDGVS